MLIVLTGKTAAGKDTVMVRLLERLPNLRRVVTTTSRAPRPNEKDGVDYNFVTVEQFQKMIDSRQFLEYVEYGGNFYGTEKAQIKHESGENLIWRIDPSRAGRVRKLLGEKLVVIYLTVDDSVVLQRLTKRGFPEEEIKRRLAEDKMFWEQYKDNYDFVIENIPGKLEEAIEQIVKIISERK